ncbi:MAG: hypothetical protein KDB80_00785, partial [Planctomycetes bacterium]|nr:hypothetical protein [Planctomycetota bacterium]
PVRARKIAVPLAALRDRISASQCKNLLEKGVKHLFAHDELGDPFLDLLMTAQGQKGALALVEKALRMRRARKIPEALQILAWLALHDHLDQEGRYQLALTRLLADGKPSLNDDASAPGGDATMGYFAALVRDSFPVFDRLRKESTVLPESLLRMGRHFSAGVGNERRFGTDLLQFVAEKHSKQRAGEEAKLALRVGGV